MLLHESYINVVIANILVYLNSFYDLHIHILLNFVAFCRAWVKMDIVSVTKAFQNTLIIRIMIAVNFSSQKLYQRHPPCHIVQNT